MFLEASGESAERLEKMRFIVYSYRMNKYFFKFLGRISLIAATIFALSFGSVSAQDSGFGAGFILGEPTGVSAKLWLSKDDAIDYAAAWSFYRNNRDGKDL